MATVNLQANAFGWGAVEAVDSNNNSRAAIITSSKCNSSSSSNTMASKVTMDRWVDTMARVKEGTPSTSDTIEEH